MKIISRSGLLASAAVALVCGATPAWADAAADAAANAAETQGDIIVTANKRNENCPSSEHLAQFAA